MKVAMSQENTFCLKNNNQKVGFLIFSQSFYHDFTTLTKLEYLLAAKASDFMKKDEQKLLNTE